MHAMRILIHTDEYYPTGGPCARRMKVFAQEFSRLGHSVTVLASAANRKAGPGEPGPERVLFCPVIPLRRKSAVNRLLNNLSFAVTSLVRGLACPRADIVLTTSPPPLVSPAGWLLARIKGAKLVYDVRDIWPDVALEMGSFSTGSLYGRVFGTVARFMYRRADLICAASPGKVDKLQEKLPEDRRDRVRLISNGFDLHFAAYPDDPETAERYRLGEGFTCVYVGNLGLAQGLDRLRDLAGTPEGRRTRFLLFGAGAEEQALRARARREGLENVEFYGVVEHRKVSTILRRADLSFISLKNARMRDSVPTKIFEALGVGCPVLLVAEGDACQVVEESGLGWCVSPDEPERLEPALKTARENPPRPEDRRRAMKLMEERYSRQEIAGELERQLRGLLPT